MHHYCKHTPLSLIDISAVYSKQRDGTRYFFVYLRSQSGSPVFGVIMHHEESFGNFSARVSRVLQVKEARYYRIRAKHAAEFLLFAPTVYLLTFFLEQWTLWSVARQ